MTNTFIRSRHASILATVEALETVASSPRPASIDGLAANRWSFTRQMLEHCSFITALLTAMTRDERPAAAARARLTLDDTNRFVANFRAHVSRWHGFPPAHEWVSYQRALKRLTISIRALIDAEVRHILPLLPPRVPGAIEPVRATRYVADASEVRRMIYSSDGAPVTRVA